MYVLLQTTSDQLIPLTRALFPRQGWWTDWLKFTRVLASTVAYDTEIIKTRWTIRRHVLHNHWLSLRDLFCCCYCYCYWWWWRWYGWTTTMLLLVDDGFKHRLHHSVDLVVAARRVKDFVFRWTHRQAPAQQQLIQLTSKTLSSPVYLYWCWFTFDRYAGGISKIMFTLFCHFFLHFVHTSISIIRFFSVFLFCFFFSSLHRIFLLTHCFLSTI